MLLHIDSFERDDPLSDKNDDIIDPWAQFSAPPLPYKFLPQLLQDIVANQSKALGCDPAGLAMAMLATCSAAIPDSISITVKEHDKLWKETSHLCVMLVGNPSARKSPALKFATAPLRHFDLVSHHEYESLLIERRSLDKKQRDQLDRDQPITLQRKIVEDVNLTRAQKILQENPDGILLYNDELSSFLISLESRANSLDRAFWLKGFDGSPMIIDRGNGPVKRIDQGSISLVGAIQPDPIRKIMQRGVDDGLIQRFFPILMNDSKSSDDIVTTEHSRKYFDLIQYLRRCNTFMRDNIIFSEESHKFRRVVSKSLMRLAPIVELSPQLATHIGKYESFFARLCIIWKCIENYQNNNNSAIVDNRIAMNVGMFMFKFLVPHATSFYMSVGNNSKISDVVRDVCSVILVKKLDSTTLSQIHTSSYSLKRKNLEEIRQAFDILERLKWIIPSAKPKRWDIDKNVHVMFEARRHSEEKKREDTRKALRELSRSWPQRD